MGTPFSQPAYIQKLQKERRQLAVHNAQLKQSHQQQKENADKYKKQVKEKDKKIRELEKANKHLTDDLEKAKVTIATYQQMLFHAHKQGEVGEHTPAAGKQEYPDTPEQQGQTADTQGAETGEGEQKKKSKKKNGQKKGHKGYGRKKPDKIDHFVLCFITVCPDCNNPVERSQTYHTHTVTDIPHWREMQAETTEYQIEYQWCRNCHKAVSAKPEGVIPGSRIGMTLFLMILIWRYHLQISFEKISETLFMQYGILISAGGLVGITKKARKLFGKRYDELLIEIRGAPVKHADETSWGMDGLLYWCWAFLTEKSVYYTIEESRGKAVAEKALEGAGGVLVRDGYAAYIKLPIEQQACFAHPYRKARDAKDRKGASEEVKRLFRDIEIMYVMLDEDLQRPFDKAERLEFYEAYKQDLAKIAKREYQAEDAKRIQTYLVNLGENLFTALLHENVPLTNNLAEQAERIIVCGRKISGGSRSPEGAKTHAVNMSILQTIRKQKLPLFQTLESHLTADIAASRLKN